MMDKVKQSVILKKFGRVHTVIQHLNLMYFLISKKMSEPKVEQIDSPVELGEGPHWDHNTQALYYVDIKEATIHKYVPSTKRHTAVKVGMYRLS
jgi:hypothetical protein